MENDHKDIKNTEEFIMDTVLETNTWKGKTQNYAVSWCHQCDTVILICPACGNSSCSGGGCSKCCEDSPAWSKVKTQIIDYLNPDEVKIYKKGIRLQRFIKESIRSGDNQINWHKMSKDGKFSQLDKEIFASFLV